MNFFKKTLLAYSTLFLVLIAFGLGWLIGARNSLISPHSVVIPEKVSGVNSPAPDGSAESVSFSVFWDAWQQIQDNYVDAPVVESDMFYGAMRGMVAGLKDPFSVFLDPAQSVALTQELSGQFEGIGAEIGIKNNQLTIIAPLSDTPAERSGLKPGDVVLMIDDVDTAGMPLHEAVERIRGPRKTDVVLTVFRKDDDIRDITVTRDTINIITIKQELAETPQGKKVGMITITNFHADTSSRFRKAVNSLLAQGPDAFVIDVRNNPGGFLDKAIDVSNYWLTEGEVVVMEKFSENNIHSHPASNTAQLRDFPTIVLINEGSASGSEIFAGALHDHNLATLVGMPTFGKGSVQNLLGLSDGSTIKLTIAKWLTPNGTEIDEEGIAPDIEVDLTEDDYNNDLDPQLEKALELLDQKIQ